jgi:tetratricopeptide (TPR) repeat protein
VIPGDITRRLYEQRLPIGIGVLAVLAAALGWWGYQTWRTRQEEAAQSLMRSAFTALEGRERGKAPEASGGQLEEAQAILLQVRKEYPSSRAAEQALLFTGNIFSERAEHEKALQAYQEYLERYPEGPWVVLAGIGKGYALEALGRYADAAATFRTLAERYKGSTLGLEARLGLARCLEQLDRRREAVELYGHIVEEYPDTPWARRAEEAMALGRR